MRHPDWAAAYVLVDWKKRGRNSITAVEAAYERYEECAEKYGEDDDRTVNAKKIVVERIDEAIRKMEVYVTALKDSRDREA